MSPPAAEVTGADLRNLQESLEQSSTALGLRFQDGLGSLSGRIELLEDNVRMVKVRALSRSALDAVSAAAAAAAAAAPASGGEPPAVVAPPDDSRIEQILASVLGDEIPMVRRNLEGVKDRVASLEAALVDAAAPPGLSAEEAATAAANAARQANEETQARMIAEMSALEERMDRRAREEARRAREEREAAEARGSMRRVSATVSAYTADLATRLDGLRSEHEQQGAVLTRTAEEIAAAEASLRDFGSELVGLGQVANSVSDARVHWGCFVVRRESGLINGRREWVQSVVHKSVRPELLDLPTLPAHSPQDYAPSMDSRPPMLLEPPLPDR